MNRDLVLRGSRGNQHAGRRKVSSGCRTCKTRKVKCDEAYPTCRRCVSAGRTCEGYGIWGGGGGGMASTRPHPSHQPTNARPGRGTLPGPLHWQECPAPLVLDAGDRACFEWFRHQTAPKLPGSFITGFWTNLLFQAASTEPSVLHATLALGAVHRRPTLCCVPADAQEVFMLRHYTKAIGHLQPHLLGTCKSSFQVSLIACIIFTCLELLRGNFETAHRHMYNGLRVLAEAQKTLSTDSSGISSMHQPRAVMLDGWITEIFFRLRIQFRLFHLGHPPPFLSWPAVLPTLSFVSRFHSTNEAWKPLGQLLDKAIDLTNQAKRQGGSNGAFTDSASVLRARQQRNQADLAQWLRIYNASKDAMRVESPRESDRVKLFFLILPFHTMAEIITATCMSPNDESIYDSQTTKFMLLVENAICLLKASDVSEHHKILPGHLADVSMSIIDMGWIPPLYYAAIKCRVHRIRLQAIRLLAASQHREAIWDSKTCVCVARRVMELEERDFYDDVPSDVDEFPLLSCPTQKDLSHPTLPQAHRVNGIVIALCGEPLDRISLVCSQGNDGVEQKAFEGIYDVASQRWDVDLTLN